METLPNIAEWQLQYEGPTQLVYPVELVSLSGWHGIVNSTLPEPDWKAELAAQAVIQHLKGTC